MPTADVDPVLRVVEWLLLFGALVWVFQFITDVMGPIDLAVHEVLTALGIGFFRLRRRQGT